MATEQRSTGREVQVPDPGTAWIRRFLQPHLAQWFPENRPLSCLQISPDDSTEAEELQRIGHRCVMIERTDTLPLSFHSETFDLVFTGRFPVLAKDLAERFALAKELYRVLRIGGSLVVVVGNRLCPLDLSRNGPLLHGRSSASCLSLLDVEDIFITKAKFLCIQPLSVCQHFGWNSISRLIRPLGTGLDLYWRWVATPQRKSVYFSGLNPTLILRLKKA